MLYFVADTHFSEENIMRYENRPFESAAAMDREIVYALRESVRACAQFTGDKDFQQTALLCLGGTDRFYAGFIQ